MQARIDALDKQCEADIAKIKQRNRKLDELLRKHKDLYQTCIENAAKEVLVQEVIEENDHLIRENNQSKKLIS